MKKMIFLSIIAIVIFAGCAGPKTEIQTEAGKVTVQEGTGIGPEWCKAGTTANVDAASAGGQMTFVVKGLTTYKGKQVCESEGKYTGAGIEMYYKQYFTQDGKYSVMIIKDSSGNVLSENEVTN